MPADQAPVQITSPTPGMFVWYGRFKNRAGIVTKVFKDEKGTLKLEIEPVPKGRKKPKTRNILPYRPMNAEDSAKYKKIYDEETKKLRERKKSAQLLALRVAARLETDRPLARFAATIDKASVEKWKKDLKQMTKIYKDLDVNEPDAAAKWDEARKLFRMFRMNFEDWVYKALLPKETSDYKHTPYERSIAKLAWDLKYALDFSFLFPEYARSPDWPRMKADKERSIRRYQGAANKVFKEIVEYLDTKSEGVVSRRDPVEHFEISGIGVILKNTGRDEDHEAELETFLRGLKRGANKITAAGFGDAVRGLTVTVDYDLPKSEWETSGMYLPNKDELIMTPLGLVGEHAGHGTFFHECGHRFYFKVLSTSARKRWDAVMTERGVKTTQEDIDRFVDIVVKAIDPKKPFLLDVPKAALPFARDESERAKFRDLARFPPAPILGGGQFVESRYRELLDTQKGEVSHIEEISAYGNTNPTEAFAEVFRLWVLKGPQSLGPWTREFFRDTCRGGGVRLAHGRYTPAENVALNWLIADPDSTADDLVREAKASGHSELWDSVTRQMVPVRDVVEALEKYAPKPLHGGDIKVYHATDMATAKALLKRGLIPETKPRPTTDEFEYAPGRGIDIGLYVGASPRDVDGYGRVILEVVVPKKVLEVPTELAQLGETDPMKALRSHDGAIINHRLPGDAFRILPDGKLAALKVVARYQAAAEVAIADLQNLADEFGVGINLPAEGQAFSWDDNDSLADALLDDDSSLTPDMLPSVKVAARYQEKKKVPKANGKGTTEVYVYSEGQVDKRNRDKAKRLQKFKPKVEKMRAKVKADLASEDRETRLVALAVALIDETHERVGNEESAKGKRNDSGKPHYGVTGWKKSHVTLGSDSATIKYVGKSGVGQDKTVSTPHILKALRRACEETEGKDGCLFSSDDVTVTAEKVNEFLEPYGITAKDLRGLAANGLMQKALKKARKGTIPSDKKEREEKLKKEFEQALDEVSEELGHEASTLKSQYLAPNMETAYLKDGTVIDKLDD